MRENKKLWDKRNHSSSTNDQRSKKSLFENRAHWIDLLNSVQFVWVVQTKGAANWDLHYQQLQEFHARHGHARVPTKKKKKKTRSAGGEGDDEWKSLGQWISKQREKRKNGTLTSDQIHRLDTLGFTWVMNEPRSTDGKQNKGEGGDTHDHSKK